MNLHVDTHSQTAPAQQIVESILDAIAGGVLMVAGDRWRRLAAQVLVNPNTVGKAYRELELHGVVRGRVGAGVFVVEDGPARARELRRPVTLQDLRRALAAAIHSGHDPATIQQEVTSALAASTPTSPTPSSPPTTSPVQPEDSPCP